MNGIVATQRLLLEAPESKVIGLSMYAGRRYVSEMFRVGASGYVVKRAASEELLEALRCVAANRRYVSPTIAGADPMRLPAPAPVQRERSLAPAAKALSTREQEVLRLIAEGMSSKEIATRLEIAARTVETHRRQIMDKLNLRTIAELTKYALRLGLTSLD